MNFVNVINEWNGLDTPTSMDGWLGAVNSFNIWYESQGRGSSFHNKDDYTL